MWTSNTLNLCAKHRLDKALQATALCLYVGYAIVCLFDWFLIDWVIDFNFCLHHFSIRMVLTDRNVGLFYLLFTYTDIEYVKICTYLKNRIPTIRILEPCLLLNSCTVVIIWLSMMQQLTTLNDLQPFLHPTCKVVSMFPAQQNHWSSHIPYRQVIFCSYWHTLRQLHHRLASHKVPLHFSIIPLLLKSVRNSFVYTETTCWWQTVT